jgi:hypothetical protein
MDHLGQNYRALNDLALDATPVNAAYEPFDVHHKGNMLLQWKITKKGCAAKKGKDFCACVVCVMERICTNPWTNHMIF